VWELHGNQVEVEGYCCVMQNQKETWLYCLGTVYIHSMKMYSRPTDIHGQVPLLVSYRDNHGCSLKIAYYLVKNESEKHIILPILQIVAL
jgi:hypothetical protein